MNDASETGRPAGLVAIEREMARQSEDALASFETRPRDRRGGSPPRSSGPGGCCCSAWAARMPSAGRWSRSTAPSASTLWRCLCPSSSSRRFPADDATVLLTSQSGESAEVLRWFRECGATADTFGLTLEAGSTLARTVPCLVGAGGSETGLRRDPQPDDLLRPASRHSRRARRRSRAMRWRRCGTRRTSRWTRRWPRSPASTRWSPRAGCCSGLAEAIALGFTELSREPAYALEGGQLRHGPMEMLGPRIGVLHFCADEPTEPLVKSLAAAVRRGRRADRPPRRLRQGDGAGRRRSGAAADGGHGGDLPHSAGGAAPDDRASPRGASPMSARPVRSAKITRVE